VRADFPLVRGYHTTTCVAFSIYNKNLAGE
jgi:hypothetical protein